MTFLNSGRAGALSVLASLLLVTGCSSTSSPLLGDGSVSYGDSKAVETITNEFGTSDLQAIAESMTRSLIQHPAMQGRPLITVAEVKNKTSEYIDTRNITNSIKTQLMKGGARFTTDNSTMNAQTDELMRQNQTGLYGKKAKVGKMQGAKYLLTGEITSIVKRNASTKLVDYKFTLMLKNIEDGIDEWQDEKEIRKTSRR
ncbi:penicillin-binding protein activator LpoB [Crenobacter cavernae]|uniref:Penicillin-binding protein activator LpoB n=1 Tax=Crenobacter cavernae TaxID=2290923 RepID=A0A345Y5B7_9NEIS|nr:penicillin-binding protein activator LpoB [Crenobacter cavernae]AXK39119.1 penicillin-binding protein activator LpoB [Crenobacter cavernae]